MSIKLRLGAAAIGIACFLIATLLIWGKGGLCTLFAALVNFVMWLLFKSNFPIYFSVAICTLIDLGFLFFCDDVTEDDIDLLIFFYCIGFVIELLLTLLVLKKYLFTEVLGYGSICFLTFIFIFGALTAEKRRS